MFASLVGAPLQTPQGPNSLARVEHPAAQARPEGDQDWLSIRASEEEWDDPPLLSPAASSREEVSPVQAPKASTMTTMAGELSLERDPKLPTTEEMFLRRSLSSPSRVRRTLGSTGTRFAGGYRKSSSSREPGKSPLHTACDGCPWSNRNH